MSKYRLTILLFLFVFSCTKNISHEEQIVELYARLGESFSSGDLRGVMRPVSKDFQSSEYNEGDYEELQLFFENYFKGNSDVFFQVKNLLIRIIEDKAVVTYEALLESRQNSLDFERKDFLKKENGRWKIYSWEYQ